MWTEVQDYVFGIGELTIRYRVHFDKSIEYEACIRGSGQFVCDGRFKTGSMITGVQAFDVSAIKSDIAKKAGGGLWF